MDVHARTVQKLFPDRFTGMSGKMAAIVACVLGERDWTQPILDELFITKDGVVLGRHLGDVGFNSFIGAAADFWDNWRRLLVAAELEEDERI